MGAQPVGKWVLQQPRLQELGGNKHIYIHGTGRRRNVKNTIFVFTRFLSLGGTGLQSRNVSPLLSKHFSL